MSMLGTLAKVAAGVMVARGVGKMIQNRSGGGSSSGGGMGDLGGMLGGMLGGGAQGRSLPTSTRDLGGMLGGGGAGGGLGGLIDALKGGGAQQMGAGTPPKPEQGGLGDLLNSAFDKYGEPERDPTPSQEDQARLLLRAMINAAKSDGKIDESEKQKILGELDDVSREEAQFVRDELASPLDIEGLVRDVPQGMEQQVYAMSVMGIDLDSSTEARYLDQLAEHLGIDKRTCNAIHEQLGAPKLYS